MDGWMDYCSDDDDEVVLQLSERKCPPLLLFGLEACH